MSLAVWQMWNNKTHTRPLKASPAQRSRVRSAFLSVRNAKTWVDVVVLAVAISRRVSEKAYLETGVHVELTNVPRCCTTSNR